MSSFRFSLSIKLRPLGPFVSLLIFVSLCSCAFPPAVFARAKPCSPAAKTDRAVSWAPPQLTDPLKIRVEANYWQRVYQLDPAKDYVIEMPSVPVTRGLAFVGGRNVVLIGGEIAIPWQGFFPDIVSRTGLRLKSATGTVHIEGFAHPWGRPQ